MGFRNGYQGSRSNPVTQDFAKKLDEHNKKIEEYNRKEDNSVRNAVMQIAVVLAAVGVYVTYSYFDHQKQIKASPKGVTQEVQDATSTVFSAAHDNDTAAFKQAVANQNFDATCLNLKGENILDVAVRQYQVGSMRKSVAEAILSNPEIMKDINPQNRNMYGRTPVEQLEYAIGNAEKGDTQAAPTAKDYALLQTLKEAVTKSQSKDIHFFEAAAMYKAKSR